MTTTELDRYGRSPLHYAAVENDGGASTDARDAQGETPLDAAARAPGARDEIVTLLGGSVP